MLRRAQAARLLITDIAGPGPRLVLLGRAPALVGRNRESLVLLDDPRIADAHARIEYRRGRYAIADLGSEAGTFVNGRRVRRGTLMPGDLIRFGGAVAYRFIDPDAHLRRRTRRMVAGAFVVTVLSGLAALHLAHWDGGLLGRANLKRALGWLRPAPQAPLAAARREVAPRLASPALRKSEPSPPSAATPAAAEAAPDANESGARASPAALAPAGPHARDRASWIARFNAYRAEAGLGAVSNDGRLSAAMGEHTRYVIDNYLTMVQTGAPLGEQALTEARGLPDYSAAGAAEAPNSRLIWGCGGFDAALEIDHWIWDPLARIAMLDPRLSVVGFGVAVTGRCWVAALRLPPPSGAAGRYAAPVEFPRGEISAGEWSGRSAIDPLSGCPGYTLPVGTPITLQLGDLTPVHLSTTSLSSGGRPLEHCAFDASRYVNPNASAQEYGRWLLRKASAVVIIPRAPLRSGTEYQVSISAEGQVYAWAFRVKEEAFEAGLSAKR